MSENKHPSAIDALVEARKRFEVMVYPNKDHGIRGASRRLEEHRDPVVVLQRRAARQIHEARSGGGAAR